MRTDLLPYKKASVSMTSFVKTRDNVHQDDNMTPVYCLLYSDSVLSSHDP